MKSRTRSGYSWRGVTTQLFVLVLLPLSAVTIGVALLGLNLHRNAMRSLVAERDERAVRAAAGALAEQLNHRLKAIQGIALLAEQADTPELAMDALRKADYLLEDFDFGLAIFARGKSILASVGPDPFWVGLNLAAPPLDTALLRDAPPALLEITHPVTGSPVILVLAVKDKGGPIAVGAFDPAILAKVALSGTLVTDSNYAVYLAGSEGDLLFHEGELSAEPPQEHPGIREALSGSSGTQYVSSEDSEHVVSYSPIIPPGWALVIEEPWEDVTSPLLRVTEYAPFVLIPALLLTLLALWFVARQIVLPLQALESRAAELGQGHYEPIEDPVGGIIEIQHLQAELVTLARKVRAAQTSLRGYIGAITTGQEEERRRLARELHDDTLQSLIALNQRVQLARLAAEEADAAGPLDEIQALAAQTITDLRRITRALRPIYLEDLGLVAALEMLARETADMGSISVSFRQQGPVRRLDGQIELAFYRIAQEALNNAARHADASRASVEITFDSTQVRLQVQDNGQGFDPAESAAEYAHSGHFGLLGIQERAELIGAALKIESRPGGGTRIAVFWRGN